MVLLLSDAILPIVATTFFLAGISILLLLMLNIFREIREDRRGRHSWETSTWKVDLRRGIAIVSALLLFGTASLTFWINGELRLYSPIIPGLPLGTISVINDRGTLPRLVYSSIDRQGREAIEVLPVKDAVFRLRGERIRWSPKLRALGMGEYFKISQIEFFPDRSLATGESTFVIDVRQGSTRLFGHLRDYHEWLPFVEVDSIRTEIWDADSEYSRHLYLQSDHLVSR